MKTRVALYDFMPYGAPELIETAPAYMSRALAAAGLLVAAGVLALLTAFARLPVAGEPDAGPVVPLPPFVLQPPPSIAPPPPEAPAFHPASAPHVGGDVIPVVDQRADPTALLPSQDELRAPGAGPSAEAQGGGAVRAEPAQEPPPGPDEPQFADEFPSAVKAVKPDYPEIAKEAGVSGTVVVQALVGRDGRVADARIQPGRSIPMLDGAALDAVRRWVFTPALANGHPVPVWVRIPIVFRLH